MHMFVVFAAKKPLLALMLVVSIAVGLGGPAWPAALAAPAGEQAAAVAGFDVQAFLDRQPGRLKTYREGRYSAAQVIQGYGAYYNLDPRVTLALLELVPRLLTSPNPAPETLQRPFGALGPAGFTAQIDWTVREVRAGLGPYAKPPEIRFTDGTTTTLALNQDPSIIAVQRFLAQGRTQPDWAALKDQYPPLFRQLFGAAPETVTPTPTPSAGRPFLKLPWVPVYPAVPGDPLAGKPVRMIHSSYFDHVYPMVDRGSDGNDFVVTYLNQGNVSYNTHDANDYYFPDRPTGTPIVAAADGIAYALTTRGNGVVIRHTGAYAGYETVYWHLDAFDKKFAGLIDSGKGIPVRAGDYLGVTGKSGFTNGGAHLHFEVRHNGKQVDPYGWFGPGTDPCAAWTAGCEASVWLWDDALRGSYDFTPPNAPAPQDKEPPVGTLSVAADPDLSLLAPFDGHPVQSIGQGAPVLEAAPGAPAAAGLSYEDGVFGRAVRIGPDAGLSYPITGNLSLREGSLSLWANLPARYPRTSTGRQYLFAASSNPSDSARGIYTGTLALRREEGPGGARWNFWTVDDTGQRQDLVAPDTLQPGWHLFTITWKQSGPGNRGAKQLYVDGLPMASASDIGLPTVVGDKLQIGRWFEDYGQLDAALDELAIFRRVLSPAEVKALAGRLDYRTGRPGPLAVPTATDRRDVVLDTNAIDRQGGVVGVRIRRDDEPWSDPQPYYDSYRWSIAGAEGLHTFAVEYRDRSDNVTVVTATVVLASAPRATAELVSFANLSATMRLRATGAAPVRMQVSASADFSGAAWQSWQETLPWTWSAGQPRIVYVRFQSPDGLIGPIQALGPDLKKIYIPLVMQP